MFLQTTAEFDHHFGINATIHERKRGDKMKVKILAFGFPHIILYDIQYMT